MNSDHLVIKLEPKPDTAVGWLAKALAVDAATTASASTFSSIAPLLAQLHSDAASLVGTQAAAANKGRKEIGDRNVSFGSVRKSLRAVVRGVQGLCDAAPDLEHAQAIARAASLESKIVSVPHRPDFYGKALGGGAVHLYAKLPVKKAARIYWEWQVSTDGGKSWLSLPNTNNASTLVPGLTPTTLVQFRYRSMYKNVMSDWSQVIVVQVH